MIAVEIYTLECLHSRVPVFSNIRVLFDTLIREYINSSGSRVCEYLTFPILVYELPIFLEISSTYSNIFPHILNSYFSLYPFVSAYCLNSFMLFLITLEDIQIFKYPISKI